MQWIINLNLSLIKEVKKETKTRDKNSWMRFDYVNIWSFKIKNFKKYRDGHTNSRKQLSVIWTYRISKFLKTL